MKMSLLMAYASGLMVMMGFRMAYSDYYGLERYVELIRVGWIPMSPWWGVGLVIWSCVMFEAAVSINKKEDRKTDE